MNVNSRGDHPPRTRTIRFAALMIAVALSAAGCEYPFPHACDGHGGIRVMVKAIYYCKDGTDIGSGWLDLHGSDPRARP